MKKSKFTVLVLITALFIGFTAGVFAGRTVNHSDFQVARLSDASPALAQATLVASGFEVDAQISIVNINTASAEELCSLPGIGETLAQRIIDYRNTNGPFLRTEDLMLIDGLGPKIYENFIDSITTGG